MPPSLHGRSHTACLRCMGRSPRGSSPRAPGRMHICPPPFCTGQRLSSQGRNAFSRSTRSGGIITKNVRKCKGLCDGGGRGTLGAPRAQTCAKGVSPLWTPFWRTSLNTFTSNFRQFSLWVVAKSRLGPIKNPTAVWYEQARPAICRIFGAWSARKMIQWIIFSGKRAGRPRNLLRNPRPAAQTDPRLVCAVYQTYLQSPLQK